MSAEGKGRTNQAFVRRNQPEVMGRSADSDKKMCRCCGTYAPKGRAVFCLTPNATWFCDPCCDFILRLRIHPSDGSYEVLPPLSAAERPQHTPEKGTEPIVHTTGNVLIQKL